MEQRRKKTRSSPPTTIKARQPPAPIGVEMEQLPDQSQELIDEPLNSRTVQSESLKYVDKECQVNIFFDVIEPQEIFICNRHIYTGAYNDLEIQTEIIESTRKIIVPNQKKLKDQGCGTPHKTYVDQSLDPILIDTTSQKFCGFASVKTEKQLLGLAGVI